MILSQEAFGDALDELIDLVAKGWRYTPVKCRLNLAYREAHTVATDAMVRAVRQADVDVDRDPCPQCGGSMVGKPAEQATCSVACAAIARTARAREARAARVSAQQARQERGAADGDSSTRRCEVCGAEYINPQSQSRYCSRVCRLVARNESRRNRYEPRGAR